ncbi:unnamed protein product [Pylaiella littoralis]
MASGKKKKSPHHLLVVCCGRFFSVSSHVIGDTCNLTPATFFR